MNARDPKMDRDRMAEMAVQVQAMARAFQRSHSSSFMILLSSYCIASEEYRATGLTLSSQDQPNLAPTRGGFDCDARLPIEQLTNLAIAGGRVRDGVVTVRISVRLKDIMDIIPLA